MRQRTNGPPGPEALSSYRERMPTMLPMGKSGEVASWGVRKQNRFPEASGHLRELWSRHGPSKWIHIAIRGLAVVLQLDQKGA